MVGVVDAPAVEVAEKVVVGRRGPWEEGGKETGGLGATETKGRE